jgi:hypothetical protein
MFMVDAEGVIFKGKRGDAMFEEPLNDENAYYLFNCDGRPVTVSPLVVRAVSIAASSPCDDHTKEFIKAGAGGLFYMPMWELTELERCRQMCDLKLTAALVTERFLLWGGVARRCFFTGEEAILKADLDEALSKYKEEPQQILSKVGGQDSLQLSHRLLHYKVSDSFKDYTMSLASDEVADLMCDLDLQAVVDRIAMLQTDREQHGFRGKLFERFAHRVLPFGSSSVYPLFMIPEAGGNRSSIPSPRTSKTEPIASIEELKTAACDIYLKPSVRNFAVADAVLKLSDSSEMFVYQMTVGVTHSLANASLWEIINQLGCTKRSKLNLVWVVPPDVDFRRPSLTDELKDVVSQWTLRLPLEVPPALKKLIYASDLALQDSQSTTATPKP